MRQAREEVRDRVATRGGLPTRPEQAFLTQSTQSIAGLQQGQLGLQGIAQTAAQTGSIVQQTLGGAFSSVGNTISGLLTGTANLGQSLIGIFNQILTSLIQWGVQLVVNATLGRTQQAVSTAQTVASQGAIAAAAAPAAAAVSISSFGQAAIIGGALAAVAIGAIIALLASGGFATGGLIPGRPSGRDNRLAAVATGEYVARSSAVSYYGPGLFDLLNSRSIPRDRAMAMIAGLSAPRTFGALSFAGGGLAQPVTVAGGGGASAPAPVTVNVALVNMRREMQRFMERDGKKYIYDFEAKRTREVRRA